MSDEMRPARLWRSLPTDRPRCRGAPHSGPTSKPRSSRPKAVGLIARQIKFRPKSVVTLPVEKKAKHLAGDGAGVRSAGRAAAGGVSPAAPAADDGALSRRARHRARERADHRGIADGAGRPRRSTRRRRRWPPSFPKADVVALFLDAALAGPRNVGRLAGPARTELEDADVRAH